MESREARESRRRRADSEAGQRPLHSLAYRVDSGTRPRKDITIFLLVSWPSRRQREARHCGRWRFGHAWQIGPVSVLFAAATTGGASERVSRLVARGEMARPGLPGQSETGQRGNSLTRDARIRTPSLDATRGHPAAGEKRSIVPEQGSTPEQDWEPPRPLLIRVARRPTLWSAGATIQ